jgi:hypothetical protein
MQKLEGLYSKCAVDPHASPPDQPRTSAPSHHVPASPQAPQPRLDDYHTAAVDTEHQRPGSVAAAVAAAKRYGEQLQQQLHTQAHQPSAAKQRPETESCLAADSSHPSFAVAAGEIVARPDSGTAAAVTRPPNMDSRRHMRRACCRMAGPWRLLAVALAAVEAVVGLPERRLFRPVVVLRSMGFCDDGGAVR